MDSKYTKNAFAAATDHTGEAHSAPRTSHSSAWRPLPGGEGGGGEKMEEMRGKGGYMEGKDRESLENGGLSLPFVKCGFPGHY